ncbi:unnamed protein product [Ixodes hexagonus]
MENTKHALLELLSSLNCAQWQELLSDPHVVGLCGHTVCKKCIASAEACGICGTPTTHREVRPDHQIKNLITCTAQLKDLLFTLAPVPAATHSPQATSPNSEVEQKLKNDTIVDGQPPEPVNAKGSPPAAPRRAKLPDDSLLAPKEIGSPVAQVSKALEKRNKLGETVLQVAAIKGNADRVKQLLEEGANPNVRDNAGWTPLHEACNHGYHEVARLLLTHGAYVNAAGPGGVTALHDATINGHPDIVLLLLRYGAALDAKTDDGLTAEALAQGEVMKAALRTALPPKVVHILAESAATQPEVSQQGPPVLLASGLDEAQLKELARCAELLGSKCLSSFSKEVTHLVVSCDKHGNCRQRTLKVLNALVTGTWILSFSWRRKACLREQRRVDESEHEAKGTRQHPNNGAPNRARLHRERQALHSDPQGLFSSHRVVLQGTFSRGPSKDDLTMLLTLGGARLLSRLPPPTADEDEDCGSVVVTEQEERPAESSRTGVFYVGASWILDCISKFEVDLGA